MTITIDKDIPPPPPDAREKARRKVRTDTDWHLLEVGDSTLVTNESSRCAALQWAPRNGVVFTSRKIPRQGWRIWRLA